MMVVGVRGPKCIRGTHLYAQKSRDFSQNVATLWKMNTPPRVGKAPNAEPDEASLGYPRAAPPRVHIDVIAARMSPDQPANAVASISTATP